MSELPSEIELAPARLSRRSLLTKAAVAGTVAWTAPVISSMAEPVAAAVGSTCPALYNFDDGTTQGWTIVNDLGKGKKPGLWNVDNSRSTSGSFSLHYGRGAGSDYEINGRHSGTATSPAHTLPASGPMALEFDIWREVEVSNGFEDRLDVVVLPSNDVVWFAGADGGTGGQWQSISIDLSAYAGQTVQIMFHFDTGDGANNNFEGIYIDDVSIPCAVGGAGAAPLGPQDGQPPQWAPELTEAEMAERYLRELADG